MPTAHTPIDLIGDIHGHADELEALLKKLDYEKKSGIYAHPERTVVFLGDYIDRGPKIKETLAIVRGMVEAGNAVALMGNHEYNALCYHTPDGKGGYLRPHEDEKLHQHAATLDQFFYDPAGWRSYLEWFRTLPLWIDTLAFRAVHACWDPNHIDLLKKEVGSTGFTEALLERAVDRDGERALFTSLEETLKGKELKLPGKTVFKDKEGHERRDVRIRWWEDPAGKSYKEHSVKQEDGVSDLPVLDRKHADGFIYGDGERPVFFGHYWLERHHKAILRHNICCLDHSVANKKIVGQLMAYRFDGEVDLNEDNLRSVDRMS
jgi:hypothetical protein